MSILSSYAPKIEVYIIDETLKRKIECYNHINFPNYDIEMHKAAAKLTDIPVSTGFTYTKALR